MICHEHRCIFIRQRKCASTSIVHAFGIEVESPDGKFASQGVQSKSWRKHPDLFDSYLVFAVIRNPWDRFVSGWKYCDSTRKRSLRDVLLHPPLEGHDYRHLTKPQHETLLDDDGKLITDHLIRFERLQEGFDEVCQKIGKPRVLLKRLNSTHHPPYQEVFDEECRVLFEQRFRTDIELFGYEF